jgi:hypothetical protein
MLPYLEDEGWQAHVLTVDPRDVESQAESLLLETVPPRTIVTRVRAISYRLTSKFGFRGLAWRSLFSLYRSGLKILKSSNYDLVYISTTLFPVFALGVEWKKRTKVPFVLDFQDPWYSEVVNRDYPGGRLKYTFNNWISARMESWVLRQADGLTSVSPQYLETLRRRYPSLAEKISAVIPFGGSESDAALAKELAQKNSPLLSSSELRLVYVGRGGSDMHNSVRAFLSGVSAIEQSKVIIADIDSISIRFIGTSYAPQAMVEKSLEALASEFELRALVEEFPERMPYFEAFREMCSSSAVLIFGSDDRAYSASKIYNCLLSRRPIFAILHRESLGAKVLREQGTAFLVEFDSDETWQQISPRVIDLLPAFLERARSTRDCFNAEGFVEYSASYMTGKVVGLFEQCLKERELVSMEGKTGPRGQL